MSTENKMAELRSFYLNGLMREIDAASALLESPIEQLMFWALVASVCDHGAIVPCWYPWIGARLGVGTPRRSLPGGPVGAVARFESTMYVDVGRNDEQDFREHQTELWLQPEIETGGRVYRPDFALVMNAKERQTGVLIECDGHDFHERTKEQAQRDKARDRDLQALGYAVARFTGSEIYRNPAACARQALDLLDARAWPPPKGG